MQKNIVIAGAVIIVLLLGFLLVTNKEQALKDNASEILTPASSFSHSHGIAVDVMDASKVYIATHEGLFLLKDDMNLFHIGKVRDDLMGFSTHPTEATTFFSSGHPASGGNIGFQKTSDSGSTWEKISTGLDGPVDFHSMAVSAINPSIIYGFFSGKLQRSIDGGKTWQYTKGTVSPFSLTTHPTDENVVYATTQNGVQMSTDRGDSWSSISTELEGGTVSAFLLSPLDDSYALVFSQTLGGLGKSTDSGVTWQKITETFGNETVLYLAFSKTEPSNVYALTDKNSVYKSTTKGETWIKVRY